MKIFNFKMATTAVVEKVEMQFSWSHFDGTRTNFWTVLEGGCARGFGVFPNSSTMNFGKR